MSNNSEKEISLLQTHLDKLTKVGSHSKYDFGVTIWKTPTIATMARIFGRNSEHVTQLKELSLGRDSTQISGKAAYDIEGFVQAAGGVLESAIAELESLGTPDSTSAPGINLTVIQNQEQTQKIDASIILEAFQNELTGTQLKELQELLEEESESEVKKEKFFKKISSFGKDVATNIVANILNNPAIWG